MTKPELMKQYIADTFIALAKTNPIGKVTIQKIITSGKIARNTFYYHFNNRLELMIYIFDQGYLEFCPDPDPILPNHLRGILNYLSAEKGLYYQLLTEAEECEALKKHIYTTLHAYIQAEFEAARGEIKIPQGEADMLVGFLSTAGFNQIMVYLLQKNVDWHAAPEQEREKFKNIYPDMIHFLIENYYRGAAAPG